MLKSKNLKLQTRRGHLHLFILITISALAISTIHYLIKIYGGKIKEGGRSVTIAKFINYPNSYNNMAMDDLLTDPKVSDLKPSANHMRLVIQKRLDFAENQCAVQPGSLIQVTEAAYQAIGDLTQYSAGLALEVMKMVFPSAEQLAQNHPYVITADHIQKLGLTYEALCEYWDSPLRGATVICVKPWYEQ